MREKKNNEIFGEFSICLGVFSNPHYQQSDDHEA